MGARDYTTLTQYLKDIRQTSFLSHDEERERFETLTNARQKVNESLFSTEYGMHTVSSILAQGYTEHMPFRSVSRSFKSIASRKDLIAHHDVVIDNPSLENILALQPRLPFTQKLTDAFLWYDSVWNPQTEGVIEEELHMSKTTYDAVKDIVQKNAARMQREIHIIAESNLPYVIKEAKKYTSYTIPFTDIISFGNKGLMNAFDYFDHSKGNLFKTYATWWIRQSILYHLKTEKDTIRRPIHVNEKIARFQKTKALLAQIHGRDIHETEVYEDLGWTAKEIKSFKGMALPATVSLNEPVGEDGSELGDMFASDETPHDALYTSERKQNVDEILDVLTPKEQKILSLRFGLDGNGTRTLEQIGTELEVTRERIRQIEAKALRRLRNPVHKRKLERLR